MKVGTRPLHFIGSGNGEEVRAVKSIRVSGGPRVPVISKARTDCAISFYCNIIIVLLNTACTKLLALFYSEKIEIRYADGLSCR